MPRGKEKILTHSLDFEGKKKKNSLRARPQKRKMKSWERSYV